MVCGSRDVPVTVIQNDNIRCGQVDTQPTSARRKQKYKLFTPWLVIFVDRQNTVIVRGSTINATILYNWRSEPD